MESIAESRLLSLLGGQRLNGLQVHVVVEMQIVQILFMAVRKVEEIEDG